MNLMQKRLAYSFTMLAFPVLAMAQVPPDAGRLLQEQKEPPQLPRESPEFKFEQTVSASVLPGGASIPLSEIRFAGNTLFDAAALQAVLGDTTGKSYDMAGLRGLADKISMHYRAGGYPFARAYLLPQNLGGGVLRIDIVEGRYGEIRAVSEDAKLSETSQSFLDSLRVGDVIESDVLERTTLILDDLPGLKVSPIIRPGKDVGTGDLEVYIEREPGVSGDVGFDNHGNRYTGEYRGRANLQFDSPFLPGDQVIFRGLYSDENMWLGSLGYSLPLGSSGLRGNISYAHTYYELAKDFANLQATGTAKVSTLGVTYPIIRSQKANLTLAASYQHKRLNDKQQLAGTDDSKASDSLPISLSFDQRDGLWGGGITYGNLSYTTGRLKLGSVLENTDRTSGQNTRGSFDKWNLDIARVQATPVSNLSLFGRISAQKAGKNMDSSEGFSLGGANGVRAYPSSEGNGDEGWLLQLELRYTMGQYSPYLFHDSGRVTLNANNGSLTAPARPNNRSIGGEGVGLRYNRGNWNLDANLSWRSHGGKPLSDTADRSPRVWITAGYKF